MNHLQEIIDMRNHNAVAVVPEREVREMTNPHYLLANGELVCKRRVDDAVALVNKLVQGCTLVELSDEELFSKGDKLDAIARFRIKYGTGILEAKTSIEFLRGEGEYAK